MRAEETVSRIMLIKIGFKIMTEVELKAWKELAELIEAELKRRQTDNILEKCCRELNKQAVS